MYVNYSNVRYKVVTRNLRKKKRLDRLWRPHSSLMKYMTWLWCMDFGSTVWQFKDFLILKPWFMLLRYQTNDLWISKLFCKLNSLRNLNFCLSYSWNIIEWTREFKLHSMVYNIPYYLSIHTTCGSWRCHAFLAPWYFSFFALCMMPFKLCLLHRWWLFISQYSTPVFHLLEVFPRCYGWFCALYILLLGSVLYSLHIYSPSWSEWCHSWQRLYTQCPSTALGI